MSLYSLVILLFVSVQSVIFTTLSEDTGSAGEQPRTYGSARYAEMSKGSQKAAFAIYTYLSPSLTHKTDSPMQHDLKILPQYFDPIFSCDKNFELRRNDRPFRVGDILLLKEFDGTAFTGRTARRKITYILSDVPDFGLQLDFVILSLSV